ncbi:MAG: DNA ligase [Dethiobacter sp.]|nr:DNA ligase [Dethiobacter sp.]
MGRMSEFDLCVGELRNAAQSLNAVADSLTALFRGSETETPTARQMPPVPPQPKPVTLEQVRAVLAEKSRDGHTAEVRALLEKHGAAKLSEINPAKYAALLAEAEVLGNG